MNPSLPLAKGPQAVKIPTETPAGRLHMLTTPWQEKDDATLLAHVAEGSHHAFAMLVERHATRFYRLAYRYVADKDTAEDIVQDAFVKLWENPAAWNPHKGAQFTTWFYRIVVNQCLDWQKKKRPLPLIEGMDAPDDTRPQDEQLALTRQQQALEKAIRALPERQQTALNLCFYEELSNQQAADIMGVGLKALQSLLMRAKANLKQVLDHELGDHP